MAGVLSVRRRPAEGATSRGTLDSDERKSDMGAFDSFKDKATDAVDEHGDKVSEGLDKAGGMVDEKTGGEHSDKINQGVDQAKDRLDSLDGQDDDINN